MALLLSSFFHLRVFNESRCGAARRIYCEGLLHGASGDAISYTADGGRPYEHCAFGAMTWGKRSWIVSVRGFYLEHHPLSQNSEIRNSKNYYAFQLSLFLSLFYVFRQNKTKQTVKRTKWHTGSEFLSIFHQRPNCSAAEQMHLNKQTKKQNPKRTNMDTSVFRLSYWTTNMIPKHYASSDPNMLRENTEIGPLSYPDNINSTAL